MFAGPRRCAVAPSPTFERHSKWVAILVLEPEGEVADLEVAARHAGPGDVADSEGLRVSGTGVPRRKKNLPLSEMGHHVCVDDDHAGRVDGAEIGDGSVFRDGETRRFRGS